jgi:hypothetical protein
MGEVGRRVVLGAAVVALAISVAAVARDPAPAPRAAPLSAGTPLRFERNEGQFDDRVSYLARGRDYTAFLTDDDLRLVLRRPTNAAPVVVGLRVVGGRRVSPVGTEPLPGVTNYFVGRDPSRWRTGVVGYGRVRYAQVVPGVDLSFHGAGEGRIEYDLELAAGEDPGKLALAFDGVDAIDIAPGGGEAILRLAGAGELQEQRPVAYQTDAAGVRTPVSVRYALGPDRTLAFAVGPHDRGRPLVIDPVLAYSTYLGGNAADVGNGIAVDAAGAAYVTGTAQSTAGFPLLTTLPGGGVLQGASDAFVTKVSPSGVFLYSTYVGCNGSDQGTGIAVDQTGSAYITGTTNSIDCPNENNVLAGGMDAFVAKLNPAGSAVVYWHYIGGSGDEGASPAIAVDAAGDAYVTGETGSVDFPVVGGIQPTFGGTSDAFVTKLNPAGNGFVYSTYLGGSAIERGNAIAVDEPGSAYVTGITTSANFPGLPVVARDDAFAVKLAPSGGALAYARSIGGALGNEEGLGIAVDAAGNAYVTGSTTSPDFIPPLPAGVVPFQVALAGNQDAFVTKLDPAGGFLYATFLGGTDDLDPLGEGRAAGIAVDKFGNMVVTGATGSTNFPTQLPIFGTHSGGLYDAYVTELNATGSGLLFSTFLGGSGFDQGRHIALDKNGGFYVTGLTASAVDFPTAVPAEPTFGGGSSDGFVTRIAPQVPKYVFGNVTTTCQNNTIATGGTLTVPSGTCPGCVSGQYTFTNGALDVLRVLYGGYHHDGTYDCNSGVRNTLVANWPSLFYATCPGEGACPGIKHAWREADGAAVTAAFIALVGFGGRTIPGVNPFCNSSDATTGIASASGDADYADKDPIRIPCDPNDTVCERDGTLGLVLPIVLPHGGATMADEYPPSTACTSCVLSQTGGGPSLPCPNGGPLLLGRCFQPATSTGDAHCIANKAKKCFGDPAGSDGRSYNLPLKVPSGPEPAKYLVDVNGHRMTGSYFRIHMNAPASYSPGGPTCQLSTDDPQIGCLVSADACSLGNAGPAALGASPNQEL